MRRKTPRFSKLTLSVFVVIFALSFISFSGSNGFLKPSVAEAAGPAVNNPGIKKAMEVQGRHSASLMGIPGVVGHGVGVSSDGEAVIKIFAVRAGIPGIPPDLEGVPTKVEVTGMFVAYEDVDVDPTARFPRPVPIGVSTGHPDITAGTIGCRVTGGLYEDGTPEVYALSNNHIYANQNDAIEGDSALQPGPYDGGQDPADAIGFLYDFEPIDFSGGNNIIDAAIAESSTLNLGTSTPNDGYGTPNSTIFDDSDGDGSFDDSDGDGSFDDGEWIGLKVQKYGRTTALTHGQVAEIDVTVDVCYQTAGPFRCKKLARFVDQIGITPGTFSAGGDSGSLIVTDDNNKNPVGLLFAGSTTRTLANRIDLVLYSFDVVVDDSEPSGSGNLPPDADFTFTTTDLTADFTDTSSDSDGNIVSYNWDFGDGNSSTEQNPSHTYATGDTYTVTLTVTDDDGATDSVSKSVTVSSVSSGGITLSATGYKVRGRQKADLEWSGATSINVDIYRDGVNIDTTANDGFYTDNIDRVGGGSYAYKVCEKDTSICSNEATVIF